MKTFLITWNEPSKYLKGELRREFITFYDKADAEKKVKELKKRKGVKNIKLQETESASL